MVTNMRQLTLRYVPYSTDEFIPIGDGRCLSERGRADTPIYSMPTNRKRGTHTQPHLPLSLARSESNNR